MPQANANGIQLEYDTFGDPADKPLLLIMGLGAQMIHWDEAFCQKLAAEHHYVVRFDNRDVGLSTRMEGEDVGSMMELMADFLAGNEPKVPYTLDDMANDSVALLDALGIQKAHVVGASMGGMIAQLVACHHPERVLSLTSIMSSTGNPDLPKSTPEAQAALLAPRPDGEEETISRALENAMVIGSPGFELDIERTTRRAVDAFRRGFYPIGVARQMAAIAANGDRRLKLQKLNVPTLVIHGAADALVPVEAGRDTHENIAGATLLEIDGMGHDLPEGAWDRIVAAISSLTGGESATRAV